MNRNSSKINFWLPRKLHRRVMAKARRKNINLSALLRAMLREWLDEPDAKQGEDE